MTLVADAKFTTLDLPNFYNAEQSWFLKQHFEFKGFKVRVIIKRNAYDEQSSAIAQVLDSSVPKWNTIASIPFSQMKAHGSYVLKALAESHKRTFFLDVDELKKQLEMIL